VAPLFADPFGLIVLFAALALDALAGEMGWLFRVLPHPVVIIGNAVANLERRLNRAELPEGDRRMRGVVTAALVVGGAALAGAGIAFVARAIPHGWLLEVFVAATLLAQRSLFDHVAAVAVALDAEGLAGGRQAVARIVGRDPDSLDEHGVARAGIESLAENFSDAVVAPVFWYALLGLPGMLAYKAANTLDSMVGYRNDRYLAFGWASARLDDVMNLVPARLSGVLIAAAALFAPRGRPLVALTTMVRDSGHHRSPNSGWPEAAMAGALGLALGGPRRYPGVVVDEPWMGRGNPKAGIADIRRALVVFAAACALDAGLVALALWLSA
jgi:adenosylcobinamide-phosphate synthase